MCRVRIAYLAVLRAFLVCSPVDGLVLLAAVLNDLAGGALFQCLLAGLTAGCQKWVRATSPQDPVGSTGNTHPCILGARSAGGTTTRYAWNAAPWQLSPQGSSLVR